MRKWKTTRDTRIVNKALRVMFLRTMALGILLGALVATCAWSIPSVLRMVRVAGWLR